MAPVMEGLDSAVGDPVAGQSQARRALPLLPLAFLAIMVFVTYAAIVWTLRRGFDWTDEAFVYTMTASNREAIGEAWGFQHLLHPLYVLTGESVLAFRVVRLSGYVLLSLALVWCARIAMTRIGLSIPRSGWVFILLLAQVGTFFAWSYPPRYLGYNELSAWLAQLGVALMVLSLAWGLSSPREQRGSPQLMLIWVALGGLLPLFVFAKVTSAVAFGAMLALALVVPNPHLRLWKRAACVGAGVVSVLAVLWVARVPVGFYAGNLYSLIFDKSVRDAFGHPTSPMVTTYLESLRFTGRVLLPALLVFALAMATFRRKAGPFQRRDGQAPGHGAGVLDGITWLLGVLLLLALISLPKDKVWPYLGELVAFIGAAGVIGLAILGTDRASLHGSRATRSFSVAVAAAAIVAAPFISALGTSNPIVVQFVFAATLWSVVLGIALVRLTQRAALLQSRARSLPALIGCVVILLAALAVKADIAKPYRSADLLTQKTSTSAPELGGLLLTDTDAAWIDWVYAAAESLDAKNVPAIAINTRVKGDFNTSGALYAFNHSGYANPWLGRDWPAAFNSLRLACTEKPPADLLVLQPGTATERASSTVGVTRNLAACGISFPGDFQVVATRKSADPSLAMTIWRLRNAGPAVKGQP